MQQGNVLSLALANDELDRFLIGEPFYFLETKDDHDEPQNVVVAFDLLILHHWQETRDPAFPTLFVQALLKMLMDYPDCNRAIYMVQNWIWYYRYCLSKKRTQPDGLYADLFEIDMSSVAAALKQHMERHRAELTADTRWAGAAWNSSSGLWEPLVRTALDVRDKLGGPDFVPATV